MRGIGETRVDPPPQFGGDPNSLNSEEMLGTALNSCLRLFFFHLVKKSNVEVDFYFSDAEDKVEKTEALFPGNHN